MKGIIVGGGIGGLATALFIKQNTNHDVIIYEAHLPKEENGNGSGFNESGSVTAGGLGLGPNGMNVLATLGKGENGLAGKLLSRDDVLITETVDFCNSNGTLLGRFPLGSAKRYGNPGVMLSRNTIQDLLKEEIDRLGIKIQYKKVASVNDLVVQFEDGTSDSADYIVGADGLHSKVRSSVVGDLAPTYSGLTGIGGFMATDDIPNLKEANCTMQQGSRGFFGYAHFSKQLMWWSTFEAEEITKSNSRHMTIDKIRNTLLDRYGNWADPIPSIIKKAPASLYLPVYEMPHLSKWNNDSIVLIGDAAHAMPPHSGQGVSCALEDAQLLGTILGMTSDVGKAFDIYASLRKPRVQKIVNEANRRGEQKRDLQGSYLRQYIDAWIRDIAIWIICKIFQDSWTDETFGWRIEEEKKRVVAMLAE